MLLFDTAALRTDLLPAAGSGDMSSFFGTSTQLWVVGLIFLRLTSLVMLVPGLGDTAVPPRLRLGFAFLLALVIAPIVRDTLPVMPDTLGAMAGDIFHEVIIGLMLGTLMRVLLFTLIISGEIMSLQTTLSFAQTANPAQAQPSTSLGTFLAMLGLVMIYATNMHHLFIRAMVDSYQIFAPTKPIMIGDATTLMLQTVTQCIALAMQMAAPLIVFALVFNVATGFVGRIMPNFPVFFAATPLSVLFGLSLMALSIGATGTLFINHYADFLSIFIRSGNVNHG